MRRQPNVIRAYRDAFSHRDLVHELDALAARAWPALTVVDLDGWRLRTSRGYTRRANSVWPRAAGDRLPVGTKIDNVERHYRARGLAPTFQISPSALPKGLDRELAARGYVASGEVQVRTAMLEALCEHRAPAAGTIAWFDEPTPRWLDAWSRAADPPVGAVEVATRILRRLPAAGVYAVLTIDGEDAAVARGVLDGGWLGVGNVVTVADQRRRGAARALVVAMARWAAARGAQRAWLAVEGSNAEALGLWRTLEFRTAYTYRYRTRPSGRVR